ncbi:MAG: AAA family ATPase [Acidobacteria bacterium]|nr:AAA family ATPase [Acidobacteriota bacterium]
MKQGGAVEAVFAVSYFNRTTDNQAKVGTLTWAGLCKMFEEPIVEFVKDNVPLFSPATFSPPQRAKVNVQALSLLIYDIDHDADVEGINSSLKRLGCAAIVGSTHSHMRQIDGRRAEPRFRIVISLKEPIPCHEYPSVWAAGKQALGVPVDEAAKDPSRIYYKPALAGTGLPYYFRIHSGAPLDWRTLRAPEKPLVQGKAAETNSHVINNGSRNATLTSLAGSMQRRGMSKDSILAALLAENAARCVPRLPDDEVQRIVKSVTQYPPDINTSHHAALQPISIESLIADYPRLRLSVIDGLLRAGEVANLIAKSKVGKSWLTYYIGLCVACGIKLFGEYQCDAGPVLLIDNELHPETLAHRIPEVAGALGIRLEDYCDRIDVITLRGGLLNIDQMLLTFDGLKNNGYKVIIIDALYRMLPAGISENANDGLAQVYNRIDQYAAMTGAAIILVHHATKGGQGEKDVTDVGAGAGAQSRAADTHIVLRPHQEEGCAVLEAVVRSWKPVEPLPLRWEFPIWRRAADLDAAALKGRRTRHEEKKQVEDDKGMEDIFIALRREPDTAKGLTSRVGIGPARIGRLLGALVQSGRVEYENVRKRGQECRQYRPISTSSGD